MSVVTAVWRGHATWTRGMFRRSVHLSLTWRLFTPKEFRHSAQGWRASRLPWDCGTPPVPTPTGLRHGNCDDDTTLSGYLGCCDRSPGVVAKRDNPGLYDATPSE